MEATKRYSYSNITPKRPIDNETKEKILNIRREQLSSSSSNNNKQTAQDRLKRLQTKLKLSNKKPDNERLLPKRSSRYTSTHTAPAPAPASDPSSYSYSYSYNSPQLQLRHSVAAVEISATPPNRVSGRLQQKNLCYSDRPRSETSAPAASALYRRRSVPSRTINAWAKPKALLDASNRLEIGGHASISANQRLSQLRDSLQQKHKESNKTTMNNNNINNNNNSNYNNNELPSHSRKLLAVPEPIKSEKTLPPPVEKPTIDDVEPMDIDMDFEKEEETNNRDELDFKASTSKSPNRTEQSLLQLITTEQDLPKRLEDHMYFVLDTNVLINNLAFVEDLSRVTLGGTNGSMLYIPYIVIKELDKLKDRRSEDDSVKRSAAVRAIHYLNNKFDDSLKIQAQSALEEAEHLIEVDSPDDSIVNCCLQLMAQVPHLMLLTNDANLRLKAKASNILVSCRSDLLSDFSKEFDALPT